MFLPFILYLIILPATSVLYCSPPPPLMFCSNLLFLRGPSANLIYLSFPAASPLSFYLSHGVLSSPFPAPSLLSRPSVESLQATVRSLTEPSLGMQSRRFSLLLIEVLHASQPFITGYWREGASSSHKYVISTRFYTLHFSGCPGPFPLLTPSLSTLPFLNPPPRPPPPRSIFHLPPSVSLSRLAPALPLSSLPP